MGLQKFARSTLFLAFCALAMTPTLTAQGRVLCDALVGFNGTVREGRFAPLILSVENPGQRLHVLISLTVTWGSLRGRPPGLTMTREAVLDEGSTSRLPFIIPFPHNIRTIHAAVSSGAVEVGSLDIEPRSLIVAGRIVVGVASDLSLDVISALGGSEGSLRVVYPRMDDLPRSWAGYDGVDALVVHDTYFRQLRSDQVEAMKRWVLSGGVLVFTGGAAALQHEAAGFHDLLPVRIKGLTQRAGIFQPVRGGAPRRVPGRLELADAEVTRGKVLAADGSLPLLVQRSLGRGKVWFLAFDPTAQPLASWDGTLSLWRRILDGDRLPALESGLKSAMEDPWMAAVFSEAHASFPPVYAILAFVAAYLALLAPLLLVRRRAQMRTRTRFLLLCAACFAAGVTGWFLFNRVLFTSTLQIMDAARLEARSGDGVGFVTEKIGFYAASARAVEARLGVADAVLAASSLRASQNLPAVEPHLFLSQEAFGVLVTGMDLDRLSARLLSVQDAIPFAVIARAGISGSSIQTSVSNGSSKPLLGCYMLVSGRAFAVGNVAAGATIQRSFSFSDGLGAGEVARMFQGPDARRLALWRAQEGDALHDGPPRLIGWMDTPVLPISFPGSRPVGGRPGLALVSVEAE
jgi:hypothetical protein